MIFELWDSERRQRITVESVSQSGENYACHCPMEEKHKNGDRKPSLSVHPEKGYNCHACGFHGAIYKELSKTPRKEIAYYSYYDLTGKLLYQKVRYDPKDFRIRQPRVQDADNTNPKDWIYNMQGIKCVLYKLPELQAALTVYVVEGEKDVETLTSMGFAATTSPFGGGAGKNKWKTEFSEQLAGKDVILIPDNDEPGKEFMTYVKKFLLKTAKSVSWLDLPEVPLKGDISDYMQNHTKEDFEKLVPKPFNVLEKKTIETSFAPDIVYWIKNNQGIIEYLVNDNENMIIKSSIEIDNIVYVPRQDLPPMLLLPDETIINTKWDKNFVQLLQDIENYIKKYLEMPNEQLDYLVCAAWILHTWLIEKFDTSPMLYFFGDKATGKSRAGEVLNKLAFRGISTISATEALLFTESENVKPAYTINEIKLTGKLTDQEKRVIVILKSRYKRSDYVGRVYFDKNKKRKTEYFDVFGPTILCTTEHAETILQSRFIQFIMQENINHEVEKKIDDDIVKELRVRLLLFRNYWFTKKLPAVESVAWRRPGELLTPLYQSLLTCNPEKGDMFLKFRDEFEIERKDEESETFNAEIFKCVLSVIDDEFKVKFSPLREEINKDRTKNDRLSDNAIKGILNRMRIKHKHFRHERFFMSSKNQIERLKIKYCITDEIFQEIKNAKPPF